MPVRVVSPDPYFDAGTSGRVEHHGPQGKGILGGLSRRRRRADGNDLGSGGLACLGSSGSGSGRGDLNDLGKAPG